MLILESKSSEPRRRRRKRTDSNGFETREGSKLLSTQSHDRQMLRRVLQRLNSKREIILSAVGAATVAVFAWSLCIRSLNLGDEGAILSQSLDLLLGQVLYRDMEAFVTPGIWFLVAGAFKTFGVSVLASRLPVFVGYLAMVFVSYRIVSCLATRAWAWGAVGTMMVFTVWAFPAWTFAFYSPFSILFALWGLERLLAWRAEQRSLDLVLSGLFLGLSIAFKQNYGALALVGAAAGLIAIRAHAREAAGISIGDLTRDMAWLGVGAAIVPLGVVAYFASQQSLGPLYQCLVIHPLEFARQHEIPYVELSRLVSSDVLSGVDRFIYGTFALNKTAYAFSFSFPPLHWLGRFQVLERLHILVYWIPVAIFATGGYLALRPRREHRSDDSGFLGLILISAFVYLGVFPRADFNHVMNVFQPVVIAGVVVVHRLFERYAAPRSRWQRSGAWFGCTLLVLYSYAAGSWYFSLLGSMNSEIGSQRGGVLVSNPDAALIDFQVTTIQRLTGEQEAVLALPNLSILNFLADRPVPTRHYITYAHDIGHDEGAGIIEDMEALGVDLVVSNYNNFFSNIVGFREYAPALATHLRSHFRNQLNVANYEYAYLKRRETPVLERNPDRFLGRCDLSEDTRLGRYAREHLLFPSLYHILGNPSRRFETPAQETDCGLDLPHGAELVASLGYRLPQRVRPGSYVVGEVWIAGSGEPERIWSTRLQVHAQRGWAAEPPAEFRVDLSRFGGEEVTLQLRSVLHGAVKMSIFEMIGFSVIWQDPRIEAPD